MSSPAPVLLRVAFREVRHDEPDDCIHYEPVAARIEEMHRTIPAHCHEGLHQFQLLVSGSLEGDIDGRAFGVRAPALLTLAPGSMHGFRYSQDAVGHQVTVPTATLRRLLEGSALAEEALGTSFTVSALPDADAARLVELFGQIAREFGARQSGRVHTLLALTTLLAVQAARHRGDRFEQGERKGLRDALMQRFLALVDAHFREQWSLAAYTAALRVTPDHLSRTCRAVAGRSALEVLHDRVLLEARRLLAYTPMPVATIAEQLGYADAAYFSRFFRRGVGHTPSDYRRQVAAGVRAAR